MRMDRSTIGNKLRDLRGEMTLEKVAADLGISVSALNMYELGNRIPRDEIKIKIADYYKTSVDSLFFA